MRYSLKKLIEQGGLLLIAAVLCSACLNTHTTPEYALGLYSSGHLLSPQKALAIQKEAEITIHLTDEGEVAYLVRGNIVCKHAAAAAERFCDAKTPVTVHITYLASSDMIMSAVLPLVDAGLPLANITTVNNQSHIPGVYALVPIDKKSS